MPIVYKNDILFLIDKQESETEERTVKKPWAIRTILIILLTAVAIIGFMMVGGKDETSKKKEVVKAEPIKYEVLDDSVVLEEDINGWLKANKNKEGFYTKKTKNETYILISGGNQATTGFGISLNKVEQKDDTINVEYEIMKPGKSDKVEKRETTPSMLVYVNTPNVAVKGKIAPFEVQTTK